MGVVPYNMLYCTDMLFLYVGAIHESPAHFVRILKTDKVII